MEYKDPQSFDMEQAIQVFNAGNSDEIIEVLLGLSMYSREREAIERWCLFYLGGDDENVAYAASVSLGHLVRIHGTIMVSVVIPALQIAKLRWGWGDRINDVLEDIEMFYQGK